MYLYSFIVLFFYFNSLFYFSRLNEEIMAAPHQLTLKRCGTRIVYMMFAMNLPCMLHGVAAALKGLRIPEVSALIIHRCSAWRTNYALFKRHSLTNERNSRSINVSHPHTIGKPRNHPCQTFWFSGLCLLFNSCVPCL